MRVNPDLEFVADVTKHGGSDAKLCQQCATCSVACPLSPALHPYPRKEMMWAAWGVRDALMGDPDIWLCHQCGDCATECTRGALPSDVLAGLRSKAIQHFAVPSFMGTLVREPRYLPVLVLISAAFIVLLVLWQQVWVGDTPLMFTSVEFEYEEFLAHRVINTLFPLAFFAALGFALAGGVRFWRAMEDTASDWGTQPGQGLVGSFVGAIVDLAKHDRFHRCESNRPRWSGHLMVFYGFMGLLFVTGMVTVLAVLEHPLDNPHLYPLDWLHPLKILGNLTGVLMVGGSLYVITFRLRRPAEAGQSTYTDWFFLGVLLAVGLTGFAAEFVRLTPLPPSLGTPVYLLHLISVFWLLIFFPYSKFAHAFYRYLAMAFARHIGRALPPAR